MSPSANARCPMSKLNAALRPERGARFAIPHELDADEEAPAAHVADLLESGQRARSALLKVAPAVAHALEQAVALDDPLHGEAGRAGGGMAREGVPGHVRAMLAEMGAATWGATSVAPSGM